MRDDNFVDTPHQGAREQPLDGARSAVEQRRRVVLLDQIARARAHQRRGTREPKDFEAHRSQCDVSVVHPEHGFARATRPRFRSGSKAGLSGGAGAERERLAGHRQRDGTHSEGSTGGTWPRQIELVLADR